MKRLLSYLIPAAALYVAFAFVMAEADPLAWTMDVRIFFVVNQIASPLLIFLWNAVDSEQMRSEGKNK